MRSQKGFGAIEGLLILIILSLLFVTGWYVGNSLNLTNSVYNQTSNSSAKPTKKADPTANWQPYSSELGAFSLKYPKQWAQVPAANRASCNQGLFDRTLFLGADADSVLKCASEFFGQMAVGSVSGDKISDYSVPSDYKNVVKKQVTANGVSGIRVSGIAGQKTDSDVFAPLEGTIAVVYAFEANGNTYFATYIQAPKGHAPSKDVLSDFDTMVTKTLQFHP
jgi:hypothetical protein